MTFDELKKNWVNEGRQFSKCKIKDKKQFLDKLNRETKRIKRNNILGILLRIILPLAVFPFIMLKNNFQCNPHFYTGISLFMVFCFFTSFGLLSYTWRVHHKLNYAGSYLEMKKEICSLELYKLRITLINYFLSPLGFIGIFMIININLTSLKAILFLSIIFIMLSISIYLNYKCMLHSQFNKLKKDLESIESLEQ